MRSLLLALASFASLPVASAPADTLAQRVIACTACHGQEGRAAPDGYHPRIAGKPSLYLFNQLVNFREGRRRYGPMVYLVDHLSDDYLREIAEHFAAIDLPYPRHYTVKTTPRFSELKAVVTEDIRAESLKTAQMEH